MASRITITEEIMNQINWKDLYHSDQWRSNLAFKKSKNIKHEFVFESDSWICDVSLGEKADEFSDSTLLHCFQRERGSHIEKMSNRITSISYNDEKKKISERTHFIWIFFETYENIIITMTKRNLKFKVVWPQRNQECKDIYIYIYLYIFSS